MRNAKKCLPSACKFEVSLHSYQAQPHPAQRCSKPQSIFTMREFRTRLGNTCKGGGVRKACTQIAVAMCLTVVLQQLFQCASTSGQCHLGGEVWAYTGSRQGPWTEGSMGRRRKSRKGNHTKPDLIGWKAASKSSKAMIDSVVTKRNRIWKACDTYFGHESHRPFQKPRKRGQEIHDGKDRNAWESGDRGSCEKRSACGSFATMATVSLVWNRRIPPIHFHLTMVLLMQFKFMSCLQKKIYVPIADTLLLLAFSCENTSNTWWILL